VRRAKRGALLAFGMRSVGKNRIEPYVSPRIAALGEQVFGEPERSWHWLRAAKRQFNGRSPLRLAATEAGARLVEELLYRIDEGMAA
jgi:uncharacterized protein (DUF2384 family)